MSALRHIAFPAGAPLELGNVLLAIVLLVITVTIRHYVRNYFHRR